MQRSKRNYRATKLKSFFFFLILAIVLWLLTKFSQEQTVSLDAEIAYTNIPVTSHLSSDNLDKISFDATTSGFDFLRLSLKKPSINISVSNYISSKDSLFTIEEAELKRIIHSQLGKSLLVKNLSTNSLQISLNKLISKEIPISLDDKITFKKGFKTTQKIIVNPTKVTVVGPSELLEKIDSIRTKPLKLENVSSSFSEVIGLINPNSKLKLSTNKITVAAPVEEFTTHRFTIPIQLENTPQRENIKVIPENITVSFIVSVTNFNEVSKNDFRIVCDFSKKPADQNFLIPEIKEFPKGIGNIELSHNKINYLIFK